jgi:hypothetical protein
LLGISRVYSTYYLTQPPGSDDPTPEQSANQLINAHGSLMALGASESGFFERANMRVPTFQ